MTQQVPTPPRVYTPESPIRQPAVLFASMIAALRESRTLAWRLAVRDIAAQYRQTMLGYVWSIAPPLATTLVWALLNGSQIVTIKTGAIPYPIFALTGTIFWQLFFDSLNAPLKQLGANRSMLNRVNFPPEALLLSGLLQVLFSFGIKLIVLIVGLLIYGVSVQWTAVAVLIPACGLIVIGMAIGMFLAPLGLLYKDIDQALPVIVGPLMLFTPVVYTQATSGFLARIMDVNPLTPLLNVARGLLYGGPKEFLAFALVSSGALLAAALGWTAYRLAMPVLIERIEA
ncbi:MAG: ABC transporter permease [Solirubrobacteraceae bacterium]